MILNSLNSGVTLRIADHRAFFGSNMGSTQVVQQVDADLVSLIEISHTHSSIFECKKIIAHLNLTN